MINTQEPSGKPGQAPLAITARRLRRARYPTEVHQAALPVAELQGGEIQPHPADQVGASTTFTPNNDRTAGLDPWLEHYNTGRRHSAVEGKPPISGL